MPAKVEGNQKKRGGCQGLTEGGGEKGVDKRVPFHFPGIVKQKRGLKKKDFSSLAGRGRTRKGQCCETNFEGSRETKRKKGEE